MSAKPRSPLRHPVLIATSLMLVAFNLRPSLTSVGPLLKRIAAETQMGASGPALLTTLPVFCLGLAGAFGPLVVRRIGIDAGVLAAAIILALGLALRGLGDIVSLYAGSAIAACGIGLAAVLLPALVKRDFSHRAGSMTGLYTMTLCIGAAAGAGLTLPLGAALGWGWAATLALWAAPAVLAAIAWAPFARIEPSTAPAGSGSTRGLLRDPLAWQVTGYMGLQSALAYILFGWLPAVLQGRGMSSIDAGFLASVSALAQAAGALVIPTLAARARHQRGWIVLSLLTAIASFLALAFGPDAVAIPAALALGVAMGGCFGLAMTLIVLRAGDAATAGALSAMTQSIGYGLASLGPLGFGLAHEASDGWVWPAALFCALGLSSLACGLGAGRDLKVGAGA